MLHGVTFRELSASLIGGLKSDATVKWTALGSDFKVEPIIGTEIDAERNTAAVRFHFYAPQNERLVRTRRRTLRGLLRLQGFVSPYLRFKKAFRFSRNGIDQGWEPAPNYDNLKFRLFTEPLI